MGLCAEARTPAKAHEGKVTFFTTSKRAFTPLRRYWPRFHRDALYSGARCSIPVGVNE